MEAPRNKSHRSTCSSINEFAFHSARGSTYSEDEEAFTAPQTALEAAAKTATVRLNVGGTSFATSLGTLTAVPGSYFAALFGSGHWSPTLVPGSQVPFIDRDPDSFKYVLSYLRCMRHADSHLALPDSPAQLRQLRAEAEFYNLPGLAHACSLGKWATAGLLCSASTQQQHKQQHLLGATLGQLPPALQQQQAGMYREPTFSQLQRQHGSANGSLEPSRSSSVNGAMQIARDELRHPCSGSAGGLSAVPSTAAADEPVSGEDVTLTMQQQQQQQLLPALAQCVSIAQQLHAVQQQAWSANAQWQQLAELVLQHLLHLPLAAQQPDLVAALANPEPSARLEFLLLYYPVGEVRVEVECRTVPNTAAVASTAAIAAAAAAGAGAGAAFCSSPSPHASPSARDSTGRASPIGLAGPAAHSRSGTPVGSDAAAAAAVAAAAAAAAAAVGGVSGVTPGVGWGGVTTYHRYVIRETPEKFVLTTHMPGEVQAVAEVPRSSFKQELNRYSTLHKLLMQQAPRASVAGLMCLLESAGFGNVQLATQLEMYYVGSNAFPGFRSIITFEL